jgi:hypothetical protein
LLGWSFEHAPYFAVFRDLHYFAALTAAGVALALGVALQRLPAACALAALFLVGWVVAPALTGSELRELLVLPAYVSDALADMNVAASNGPGRVLWLPAEEPIGPRGGHNQGRDFTAYGPPGNPSVSDDYQNPQLAYALATLRSGAPDWNAFAAMNVRYLVFRNYIRSERRLNFGTGFPMAFEGLGDERLGRWLEHARPLVLLRKTPLSSIYEFAANAGATYAARTDADAMLYSELGSHRVAIAPEAPALSLPTSLESADPRLGWVAGTLGWRYAPWLPDSVYPFVWTLSARPLAFDVPAGVMCVLAGALPHGAKLTLRGGAVVARGAWKRYAIAAAAASRPSAFLPANGDVSAVAVRPCGRFAAAPRPVFVFASGYDIGWRAIDRGGWTPPARANGWMMAWDASATAPRLVYIPGLLQLAGIVAACVVLGVAIPLARRADARARSAERV